ncbi:hypothetical protein [Streptomyces alanosinicus]|uniref:hypothetical protein n=1 Tax=Streptomyces alanosinicus TaxID=68171 RepID=UPI001E2C2015|nr:hypothetical protein [Streptomyces alanosinicus]
MEELRKPALVVATLLLAAFVASVVSSLVNPGSGLSGPQLAALAALCAGFYLLSRPEALAEFRFGPLGARFQEIDQLKDKVRALQLAIGAVVTNHERNHMEKLVGTGSDYAEFVWPMIGELQHLQAMGYIDATDGVRGVRAIAEDCHEQEGEGFHLRDFVRITPTGEEYLSVYKEWFEVPKQRA